MVVIFAYYGVRCRDDDLRADVQVSSTAYAAGRCDGRSYCNGFVHNAVLSDPYPGCLKDFIVVARCSTGAVIADMANERKFFELSC